MAELKLPKLPDRGPVKLVLALPPDLARALADYHAMHNELHSADKPLSELAVHMLAVYLASDRGFARARAARNKPR